MGEAVNMDLLKKSLQQEQLFHSKTRKVIYLVMALALIGFIALINIVQQRQSVSGSNSFVDNLETARQMNNFILSCALIFILLFMGIYYWSYAHMSTLINQHAPSYVVRITPMNIVSRIWIFPVLFGVIVLLIIVNRFASPDLVTNMLFIFAFALVLPKIIVSFYRRYLSSVLSGGLPRVEESLGKYPNNTELVIMKIGLITEQGDLQKTEMLCKKTLECKFKWGILNIPLILNNIGICLLFQQRYDEANEILETSIRTNPLLSYTYDSLAMSYLEQNKNLQQALELSNLAIKNTNSKLVDVQLMHHATAARAHALVGNNADAKSLINNVLQQMDQIPLRTTQRTDVHRQIGYAYLAIGETDAARTHFTRAIELNPNGLYGRLAQRALESLST